MPQRKRSPRAPVLDLREAIERTRAVYEREGRNAVPADVAAQDMGYSNAKSGVSARTLAALKGYGLMEKADTGHVEVSKDFEKFLHAPEESEKYNIARSFLNRPDIFAELLSAFEDRLPSNQTIKYKLIQRGFGPNSADQVAEAFEQSHAFVSELSPTEIRDSQATNLEAHDSANLSKEEDREVSEGAGSVQTKDSTNKDRNINELDRIPVRLGQGRKAWLEIPIPFYSRDKLALKRQIDIIIADDELDEETPDAQNG